MPGSEGDDVARRVEEKLTFLEREVDCMRDEVREMWARIAGLEKRCEHLARSREDPEETD